MSDDVVPRRGLGTRGGTKEAGTGTGLRAGIGDVAKAGTRTKMERRVAGRQSLGHYNTIIPSDSRDGSTDAREREGATPTSNLQPQPQDLTYAPARPLHHAEDH